MNKEIFNRIYQLLCVKSIVTLLIVIGFLIAVFKGIENETLKNIVMMVVSFYFGTQVSKSTPIVGRERSEQTNA